MKITTSLFIALFCLFLTTHKTTNAETIINNSGGTHTEVLSSTPTETIINITVDGYKLIQANTQNKNEVSIAIENGSAMLEKGAPDLNKLTTSLIIPDKGKTEVAIEKSEYIEISDIQVAPSKGKLYRNINPDEVEYTYGSSFDENQFYPGKLADLRDPYILRNYRGQTVITYPLQYNPVTKVLRIYTSITLKLKSTSGKGLNELENNKNTQLNAEYHSIYSRHFLNYPNKKYTPVAEQGNMLIVCASEYLSEIEPLVEWKNTKGIPTELVEFSSSTTGTSASDLETYVQNYYSTNGLTFLLLVGDAEDIPSLSSSGDSDVAYSYVSGSDHYPEFFVGRFSAESTADVITQVDRTIFYEKDIDASATWLTQGIGIASSEGTGGQGDDGESDAQHMTNIKTDLLAYNFTAVENVYDPGASASDVAAVLNNGTGVINYVGHGSDTYWVTSGFGNSDCNSLTNENKLPFIFDVACVNGNFHGQTCFAEAFLRATNNGNPTGAVAMVASTINQSWAPPMDGQDEMNDILVESYTNNIKRSFAGIAYNGCLHMNDEYGADGDEMTDTWTTFGDPSVIVRTKAPDAMTITHDSEILIGTTSLTLNCNANDALVCLSENGEIIATAIVSNGTATLAFSAFTDVTTCNLVVTAYNKITYQANINVLPAEGPYISVRSFVIDDAASNNNSEADYNESFILNVSVKNVGVENANAVIAILSTTDTNITITQPNFSYGNVAIDETVDGSNFALTTKYNITNNYLATVVVSLADNDGNTWQKELQFTINAPEIVLSEITVAENPETKNNNNGRIDPGESGTISVDVKNKGNATADLINVLLNANSPYIVASNISQSVNDLNEGETTTLQFAVTANNATPNGTIVESIFTASANTSDTLAGEIIIGQSPNAQLGDGTVEAESYPFNNYYENNKTQILYFTDEFSGSINVIQDISFDISSFTSDESKRDLTDFSVKMGTTTSPQFDGGYIDVANATTVFTQELYMLPGELGWFTIDIADYTYDSSNGNLFVEITWGDNGEYCLSGDRTKVNASPTSLNSVAHGQNDSQTPPNFSSAVKVRPNTKFTFEATGSETENVELNIVSAGSNLPLENATVTLGSLVFQTAANGLLNIELAHGTYDVTVKKYLYMDYLGTITVTSTDTIFNVPVNTVGPTHNVEFTFLEDFVPVADMKVTFNSKTKFTQVTGTVLYDFIPEGEWEYEAEKEGYYPISGTVAVEKDTTVTFEAVKIPTYDVRFVIKDGETLVEGASVLFNNLSGSTNSEGIALFEDVQIGNDLKYAISKTGFFECVDSLDLVDQDLEMTIPLQFIPDVSVIVNNQYGEMSNAKVQFQGDLKYTNDNGFVTFTDVNPGEEQVIKIFNTNYYNVYDTIDVSTQDISLDYYLAKKTDLKLTVSCNGEFIADASVTINNYTKQTNQEGLVTFYNIDSTNALGYSVKKDGYFDVTDTITITIDDLEESVSIYEIPDIAFNILDKDEPIENVEISLNGTHLKTDANGYVKFENVSAENAIYNINYSGYYSVVDTFEVGLVDTILTLSLNYIPDVSFTVTNGVDPIAGATVHMNGITRISNPEGQVTFTDIEAGKYAFEINKSKYITYLDTIIVGDTNTTQKIEMEYITYMFSIAVTNGETAITNAATTIGDVTILTDETGLATFNLPIADDYNCLVVKEGFYSDSVSFNIIDTMVTEQIELMLITYSVEFEVIDNDGPVSEAQINFNGDVLTTDTSGIAVFDNIIPAQNLPVTISKDGYVEFSSTADIAKDTSITFNVTKVNINDWLASQIILYPNPSNGIVNVTLPELKTDYEVQVYNSLGELVFTENNIPGNTTINLSNLKKGTYLFNAISGENSITKRIILQ